MISLEEFNNKKYDGLKHNKYPKLNGIECPNCKKELYDTNSLIMTSYPAKKSIHCESCNYRGYRLA